VLPRTDLHDLRAGQAWGGGRGVRLAVAGQRELAAVAGCDVTTVESAVARWKSPRVWHDAARGDVRWLDYAPAWAYPSQGGALLYHVRDHADPLPWALLNHPDRRALVRDGTATALLPARADEPTPVFASYAKPDAPAVAPRPQGPAVNESQRSVPRQRRPQSRSGMWMRADRSAREHSAFLPGEKGGEVW
jgi:hypothetical protein